MVVSLAGFMWLNPHAAVQANELRRQFYEEYTDEVRIRAFGWPF